MKIKTFINCQKGASAVEAAIVIPLLALIAFGGIELGLLFYNKQIIVNASREGARAGIVRDSSFRSNHDIINDVIKQYCKQKIVDFGGNRVLLDDDIVLNPATDGARQAAAFGSDFSVQVTYNYTYLVPALFGLDSTKTITHLAVMKMEPKP